MAESWAAAVGPARECCHWERIGAEREGQDEAACRGAGIGLHGHRLCRATPSDITGKIRPYPAISEHIYWEYESGTKEDQVELMKLLDVIREGDTIAATEVSRLTRSTKQLCEILQMVQEKKIRLLIGSFSVDCRSETIDPMTKGMLMMWGVFSEMERDIISQRVKSGMKNAAAKGKRIGRPRTTAESLPDKFWKYYRLYQDEKITISEMSRLMKCSRTTVYNYISKAKQ